MSRIALRCLCLLAGMLVITRLQAQVPFLRGDANDDGRVSIADAHYISLWIYGGGPPPPCIKAADANDDGFVGLGGLDGRTGDLKTIAYHRPCASLQGSGCFQHEVLAEPREAPGTDPTPDKLVCESYTGAAQPVVDPEAKLELLAATCPGGASALAIVKVRLSCSRTIGGYSGAFDAAGLFAAALTKVDVDGSWAKSGDDSVAVVRDGLVHFTYLDREALGASYPEHLNMGFLPPARDQVVLKIYLRLEPGTPAGVYPLTMLEGELADSTTGQAIVPALGDGVLTVAADVATDARASFGRPGNGYCPVRDAEPPTGPEDVQVTFRFATVAADQGTRVTMPLWIETNAPLEGFTFSIVFNQNMLRPVSILPVLADARPWDVFEHEVHPEGQVLRGRAVFRRGDPTAALEPGKLHEVLRLEFEVDAAAPDGEAMVHVHDRVWDPPVPGSADWLNTVHAYGQDLRAGQITCFDRNDSPGLIIVGPVKNTPFRRGDANSDGSLSLADITAIVRLVLLHEGRFPCEDAADANDSGSVNFTDAVWLLRRLFEPAAGVVIPPPFPEPGLDETFDPVPCEDYRVTPPSDSGDRVRLGTVQGAPGEPVSVPIYLTLTQTLEAYQLLVRHDPALFLPTLDQVQLEGSALAGSDVQINLVVRSVPPGDLVAALVLDPLRRERLPIGEEFLAGWLLGYVNPDAPVGVETRLELLALGDGPDAQIDRRRTEIVARENNAVRSFRPVLEAGTLRVVSSDEATFIRGDANSDLAVNLTDAIFTLRHLFLAGPEPFCPDAADADDSGRIELTDAVFTLNFLFGVVGARPLPPPYPERGRDAEVDGLTPCRKAGQ